MIVDFTVRGTQEEIDGFRSLSWRRQREILASVLQPGPSEEMTVSLAFQLPGGISIEATGHGPGQCKKVYHQRGGPYLHGPDDDGPYDVDGVSYCGRCHRFLEKDHP